MIINDGIMMLNKENILIFANYFIYYHEIISVLRI